MTKTKWTTEDAIRETREAIAGLEHDLSFMRNNKEGIEARKYELAWRRERLKELTGE